MTTQRLAIATILAAAASTAAGQTVLLDLGPATNSGGSDVTTGTDTSGNQWSNFRPGTFTRMLATDGGQGFATTALGVGFGAASIPNNGVSTNTGTDPGGVFGPDASLGALAVDSATRDYVFTTSTMVFVITDLDRTKTYNLSLFGSRRTGSARTTQYTVTDANGSSSQNLQTSGTDIGTLDPLYDGNDGTVITFENIVIGADNRFELSVSVVSGGFAYLNALSLSVVPAPAAALPMLAAGVGMTRRRR